MTALHPGVVGASPIIDWAWIGRHTELIGTLLLEHVQLTAASVLLGALLGLPLSLAAVRWPRLYPPLLGVAGVLFTIPAIALFFLLLPLTGLSMATVIVPLGLYTLLILVRNTVEGFRAVDPDVSEAAAAMGFRRARQILRVELPLALPTIVAGLRIATVTTVGLATVGTLVGAGGLGDLFVDGAMRRFPTPTLVGVVLAVGLAVIADLLLLALQRALTPWRREAG